MARRKRPVLGVDYIMDEYGRAEFTREFLLGRGYCCELSCRFCPFEERQGPHRVATGQAGTGAGPAADVAAAAGPAERP